MNNLGDLLYDYLLDTESERLSADAVYQKEKSLRDAMETALLSTMTPQQRRLQMLWEEQENTLSAIENRCRFTATLSLVRRLLLLELE